MSNQAVKDYPVPEEPKPVPSARQTPVFSDPVCSVHGQDPKEQEVVFGDLGVFLVDDVLAVP